MNTFGSRSKLRVGNQDYEIYRLDALDKHDCPAARLPFSLKILLENLLRTENGRSVTADDIRFLAGWKPEAIPDKEIAFTPARVLMQDFTGVPAGGDLAAMRDAMKKMGGDPNKINPPQPAERAIDQSGQGDEFATATDLVLTVTEILRKTGVVGKFVEFFGPGLAFLPLADRATIANMAPEYGATCGIFPVDETTLKYLRMTGRSTENIALVEAYCKEQGLFHTAKTAEANYSQVVELDLSKIEPSVAGPKRPQDRVPLSQAKKSFAEALPSLIVPN